MTRHGQRVHDVGSACEAGLDAVATIGHQRRQPISRQPGDFFIEKTEGYGQGVRRLCIAANGAVIVHVMIMKCCSSAFGKISEVLGFLASSEKFCSIGKNPRVPIEAGGSNYTLIRLGESWLIRRRRWVQPIAELKAGVPQTSGRQQ